MQRKELKVCVCVIRGVATGFEGVKIACTGASVTTEIYLSKLPTGYRSSCNAVPIWKWFIEAVFGGGGSWPEIVCAAALKRRRPA